MSFDDFNQESERIPPFKFDKIGATVKGRVLSAEKRQARTLDGDPDSWPDGNPKMQWVITLATELRDDSDDDGKRRLYAKVPSNLLAAIKDASAKGGGLKEGGTLAVRYDADGEPTKRGFNPPKMFKAKYEAPVVSFEDEEPF